MRKTTILVVLAVCLSFQNGGSVARASEKPTEEFPPSLQVWGPDLRGPEVVEKVPPDVAGIPESRNTVTVELWIDEYGTVRKARILAGIPALNQSALAAAEKWKFKPATVGGIPVRSVQVVTVAFNVGGRQPKGEK